MVSILDAEGKEMVRYTYDAWGAPLTTTGTKAATLGWFNPLRYRGYVYDRETDLYYLQSRYYDPQMGRFISADIIMGVNADMATYNLFAYCGNNPVIRYDTGGTWWKELVSTVLHKGNEFAILIGIDTAAIGAFFLMMEADEKGVYHASYDCWQQYAGYNELYDVAFDIGTSMESAEFSFIYKDQGYTIWIWKGDYINLGAGAEMGIYRGDSGHRTVDKFIAQYMSIAVAYDYKVIIEYSARHWWITGFNPEYLNVSADDLTASYLIRFDIPGMYKAFKNSVDNPRWTFYDSVNTAVFLF